MALQVSFAFTTFLIVLSLFWLLKVCRRSKPHSKVQKLPPGPRKLPIIGNMHNLIGSLPHHALQKLAAEHGPLMHLQLGEISAVVVSSPRVAGEVMKTHDLAFVLRPQTLGTKIVFYDGLDIAFAPYGDYWRQMRKVCILELLSAKRVQSFSSLREDEVCNLIKSIHSSSGSPINFTENIFSLTSKIVSRAAFGNKCKDRAAFALLTKEISTLMGGFHLADLFPSKTFLHVFSGLKTKLENIHRKVDKMLDNIINDHRENQMSAATGNGELSKVDLVDVLLDLQQSDIPVECRGIYFIAPKVIIEHNLGRRVSASGQVHSSN
nr:cytochrome p450 71d8 [Quercus suber]